MRVFGPEEFFQKHPKDRKKKNYKIIYIKICIKRLIQLHEIIQDILSPDAALPALVVPVDVLELLCVFLVLMLVHLHASSGDNGDAAGGGDEWRAA